MTTAGIIFAMAATAAFAVILLANVIRPDRPAPGDLTDPEADQGCAGDCHPDFARALGNGRTVEHAEPNFISEPQHHA